MTLYNEINHLSLSSNGVMKFSLHLIFHLMYTFKFWSHVWLNGPRTFAYFHFYIFKYFQEEKDSLISPFAFSTSFSISFRLFKLNFHLYVSYLTFKIVTFLPSSFNDIYQQNVPTKILLFHLLSEFFIDKNLCWDLKTSENLKFDFCWLTLLDLIVKFDYFWWQRLLCFPPPHLCCKVIRVYWRKEANRENANDHASLGCFITHFCS